MQPEPGFQFFQHVVTGGDVDQVQTQLTAQPLQFLLMIIVMRAITLPQTPIRAVDADLFQAIGKAIITGLRQLAFEGIVGMHHDHVVVARELDQLFAAIGIDVAKIAEQNNQTARARNLAQAP